MNEEATVTARVLAGFSAFDGGDPRRALAGLTELYDDAVHFEDPLQSFDGLPAFMRMMERFVELSRSITFVVHDHAEAGEQLFLTWTMTFVPRYGPTLVVDGVSHLRHRGGRVTSHRDYWDVVGSALDALPVAGGIYRQALKRVI